MLKDPKLWNELRNLEIDSLDADFKFGDRLQRENAWSRSFAAQAVAEYKKFVYLAVTSEFPVTPSDVIDQVWHLHLTYTRSYWQDMCGGVLGRPLHHGPTKGGAEEDRKYHAQYAYTLSRYRDEFGAAAPVAFWPAEEERFTSGLHQQWVDRRRHIVLPRKALMVGLSIGTTAAASAVLLGSAAAEDSAVSQDIAGFLIPGAAIAVFLLILVIALARGSKRTSRKRNAGTDAAGGGFIFGCSSSSSGDGGSGCASGCGGGGCGS